MKKVLWTPSMLELKKSLEDNQYKGVALLQLCGEDSVDFTDFLNDNKVDYLCIGYDSTYVGDEVNLLPDYPKIAICVYGNSATIDKSLSRIKIVKKEKYGYSTQAYSKYIAKTLYDYAKNNLILIEDKNLIKELWANSGLPIPFTNASLENNNTPDSVEFFKSSLLFKNQNGVYQMRRAKDKNETTHTIEIVKALLCDGLDKISEKELRQRIGKVVGDRAFSKDVDYLNGKIKPLFGKPEDSNLEYDLFSYKRKKEKDADEGTISLNPKLRDRIKIIDEDF